MKNRPTLLAALIFLFLLWPSSGPLPAVERSTAGPKEGLVKTEMVLHFNDFLGGGIYFQATLNGAGPFLMLIDTGSGASFIKRNYASTLGMTGGRLRVKMDGLNLGTQKFSLYDGFHSEEDFEYLGLPGDRIWGLAGNDFFRGCSLGLNFRDREIWLAPARAPDEGLPHPDGTRDPVIIPIRRPKGYPILDLSFGEPGENGVAACRGPCIFDTGCSDSVILEEVWKRGSHRNEHVLPAFSHDVNNTLLRGYFQRVDALWAGDFRKTDTPVHVIESWDYLRERMSKDLEIAEKVAGILGIESVLEYHTVVDFENDRILLYAYEDCDHLGENRFSGFGFVLEPGSALVVGALVPGSEAQKAGIKKGDVLLTIARAVGEKSEVDISLDGIVLAEPGTHCMFIFERDGEEIQVELDAEDLLPPLEETE